MQGIAEPPEGARPIGQALSAACAGTTLASMVAGRTPGRYRLRTLLRGVLPYVLSDRIPKGARDCGNHEWYRQDAQTYACYHCEVGHKAATPANEPKQQSAALAL